MKRRTVILFAIGIVCVVGIYLLQGDLHRITGENWQVESMTYLPGRAATRELFLGFETTVAHYLWIRTVLYFGGHRLSDRQYPWLVDMLDIITRLSPWFYPAYEFAGLMLPDVCGNPDAARIILERGLSRLGTTKWNIAFYLGMIYYEYYDDRKIAAEYLLRAAAVPGKHRKKLFSLAASFLSQAGVPYDELPMLLFTYETSENPEVRRHLAETIGNVNFKKGRATADDN